MKKTEKMVQLESKLVTLKKNIDAVGQKALETRYATAYNKLLSEIRKLSDEVIREKVMFLDLKGVKEESLSKFAEILEGRKADVEKCLVNADFDAYITLVEEMAIVYASCWCDNVIQAHVSGEGYIYNPFTMEEVPESEIIKTA